MARFAALAALLITSFTPATAGVLFDTQALGEPLCGVQACETEGRGSDLNYAAVLSFSADVSITKLGIWTSVDDAQNVKFLIFDSLFNGGTGNVLFSQTKAFGVTSAGFIYTDPISFTFLAGRTYDVGILGDGNTLTGRWIAGDNIVSGAITAISQNANIHTFAAPRTGGYSGVVPYIQLLGGSAVPEPASWALMIGGFGLVGAAMRKRRIAQTA